jgi:signal transduction histidine kinase
VSGLGGRSVRLAVGSALVVVALVEVYSLLLGVRSQRRLREATIGAASARIMTLLPQLQADLGPGGVAAWEEAARRALGASLAAEVEVFGPGGRPLFSHPTVSPVGPWPIPRTEGGRPTTLVAQAGPVARALTWLPLPEGGGRVLRLSTPVPELERDLLERRYAFVAHIAALSVLALAAGLLLLAPAGRPPERAPAHALDAYEEAMGRLRDRGEELSREHEAERQRMEGELREKDAMARAGELTAGIVHEVRNGLGTILGYARLLEREGSPGAADAAHSIREECETLEVVIRRFMQFVKQETLSVAPFDLERMLVRVVARESRSRPGAPVSLTPSEAQEPLFGDEEMLERAFENLVRNAREAAGPGGHVHLAVAREGDTVTVAVEDDGPGLARDTRDAMRPFFTTKPGGLGLGLPIALKIVRLHQGELVLEDRTPRGVRASLRLPVRGPRS